MKEVQKAVLVICCLLEKGRRRRSDAALGWRLTIICEHARQSLASRFSLTGIYVFCTCSLEDSGARRGCKNVSKRKEEIGERKPYDGATRIDILIQSARRSGFTGCGGRRAS